MASLEFGIFQLYLQGHIKLLLYLFSPFKQCVFTLACSVLSVHYGAVEYLQCRGLESLPSISHVIA